MSKQDGGQVTGCTLRDFFAAQAMVGLIDGYDFEAREKSVKKSERTGFDDQPHEDSDATYASQLAGESYIIADAMLAARDADDSPLPPDVLDLGDKTKVGAEP